MTPEMLLLVSQLEAVQLGDTDASPERLAALLAERQEIIARIGRADTSGLPPRTCEAVRERVRAVQARDAALLAALESRRQDLLQRLDRTLHAREATRGYRAGPAERPRGLDKRA